MFQERRIPGYVGYDTITKGEHSRVGLPGTPATEPKFAGDWMIEVVLAEIALVTTSRSAVVRYEL